IEHCGVCHSDIHTARGEWGATNFPVVPGHEITGTVRSVGPEVKRFKAGDKVGVGCYVDSCRTCAPCLQHLEIYCEKGANYTYNSFEKDGKTPTYGGYSTHIVVDENYVLRIPEALPLDRAAPLLCAGITTYSPLRHWKVGPGKKVAVIGLGGLGHMAIQLAHAMGAEVIGISQSLRKKEDGLRFGAKDFYASSDPSTFQKLANSFDLIVNTVSADMDWNAYLGMLKLDGVMVQLGAPPKAPSIQPFQLILKRRSLSGSLVGGLAETQEMLDFCAKHKVLPEIEKIDIQEINDAYERMMRGDVRYRFVIDMKSLDSAG
ncbi:MAG TPA: NAD(P)-dependent alcohol dehydrogenase, partial [bacterium]|nr:NAD(P)-dependent alcohol dehydrogenase [bacterium]